MGSPRDFRRLVRLVVGFVACGGVRDEWRWVIGRKTNPTLWRKWEVKGGGRGETQDLEVWLEGGT